MNLRCWINRCRLGIRAKYAVAIIAVVAFLDISTGSLKAASPGADRSSHVGQKLDESKGGVFEKFSGAYPLVKEDLVPAVARYMAEAQNVTIQHSEQLDNLFHRIVDQLAWDYFCRSEDYPEIHDFDVLFELFSEDQLVRMFVTRNEEGRTPLSLAIEKSLMHIHFSVLVFKFMSYGARIEDVDQALQRRFMVTLQYNLMQEKTSTSSDQKLFVSLDLWKSKLSNNSQAQQFLTEALNPPLMFRFLFNLSKLKSWFWL